MIIASVQLEFRWQAGQAAQYHLPDRRNRRDSGIAAIDIKYFPSLDEEFKGRSQVIKVGSSPM